MTLVELTKKGNSFYLHFSQQEIPEKRVNRVGISFNIDYPRESWHLSSERIRRAARKNGFEPREYNAYREV